MQILTTGTETSGVWNRYLRAGYSVWQPGQECEFHSHQGAVEIFIFLAGECEFSSDTEVRRVPAGSSVYVGPGEKHKLKALGEQPLEMFMVVTPNHAPTHTFYRPDGTPVHWNRPAPGSAEAGHRPMGLTKQDLETGAR